MRPLLNPFASAGIGDRRREQAERRGDHQNVRLGELPSLGAIWHGLRHAICVRYRDLAL